MDFADDTADMSEDELFQKHYDALKKLRDDSLIILDNYNVLPKDDAFFCICHSCYNVRPLSLLIVFKGNESGP